MALPDGTEIQIFWPAPADSDEITRATAYRVCRLGDTVAQGRTLADVVEFGPALWRQQRHGSVPQRARPRLRSDAWNLEKCGGRPRCGYP